MASGSHKQRGAAVQAARHSRALHAQSMGGRSRGEDDGRWQLARCGRTERTDRQGIGAAQPRAAAARRQAALARFAAAGGWALRAGETV